MAIRSLGTAPAADPVGMPAFTWDDLQKAPDDGCRRELVDGQLFVTPSPAIRHQRVVARLSFLLQSSCPEDLEVILSPCDWKLSSTTVFVPDLMVVRLGELDLDGPFTGTPLLVVEVRSPSTAAVDRTLKRQQYGQYGAAAYWLVDPGGPDRTEASLTVLRLGEEVPDGLPRGDYLEEVTVRGDDPYQAELPFPVVVVPNQLVR